MDSLFYDVFCKNVIVQFVHQTYHTFSLPQYYLCLIFFLYLMFYLFDEIHECLFNYSTDSESKIIHIDVSLLLEFI